MLRATRRLRMVLGLTGSLVLVACDKAPRDLSPWSRTLPGADGASLVALAIDPQGEPAIAGVQTDPGNFEPGVPGGGNGGDGLFLAMLSDTGQDLWGGSNHTPGAYGHAVALAPNGDVLLLGSFYTSLDLDGHTLSADGPAAFLARFDPRGKLIWSKVFVGAAGGKAIGLSLAMSASGDAVIGGALYGDVDFGGGLVFGDSLTSFVARFDENGNHLWSRALRGGYHQVSAVAIDATGAVVVVGSGNGLLSFDSPDQGMDFTQNAFVARLSPAGEPVFITPLMVTDNGGYPILDSVAVDAGGDIVCGGNLSGSLTFGSIEVTAEGDDPFVARLSSTGAPLWLSHFGTAYGNVNAVAVAPDSTIYATGFYQGDHLNLGASPLGAATGTAMFLVELDAEGTVRNARTFGDGQDLSTGRALVMDPQGALLIGGHFRGSLAFQDRKLTSPPDGSSFVARLSPPFLVPQPR